MKTRELPLMESYYTIQGEGCHQGKAAYFIRLAGCDVGCHWCDVKDSWNAEQYPVIPVRNIVDEAIKFPSRLAVITGGEPMMYNLDFLTGELHKSGFKTHAESSGAYKITGAWDWICFSPKKFKKPDPDIYNKANELKVIIYNKSDFDWAEEFVERVTDRCRLFLQPEWSMQKEMMPLIIDYIKNNPQWEMSLQIHKFMNIP